jgi:hypothetical protein
MTEDDDRHGTYAGYQAGCREKCCREVKRAYNAVKRQEYRERGLLQDDHRHGTRTGYIAYSCRCADCTRAEKVAARLKRGLPEPTRPESTECEACGEPFTDTPRLDHCHDTGEFRGWLCDRCNRCLGQIGDTTEAVWRLLDYMLRWEADRRDK